MNIKIRYTVTRYNGHTFFEIFTLKEIEQGKVIQWYKVNLINDNDEVTKQVIHNPILNINLNSAKSCINDVKADPVTEWQDNMLDTALGKIDNVQALLKWQ